jgi:hypothetical protein
MRIMLASLAVFGLIGFATGLSAQTQPANKAEISSPDNAPDKKRTHDRSTGFARIKVPSPQTPPANPPEPSPPPPTQNPTPPSEGEDIPPSETPPGPPPSEEPPTYYGEPVQGKFAFVLDASGSMSGSKMATLRAETTGVIAELTEDDELDCVAYGDQFGGPDYSRFMWQALLPATDGNKGAATSWVNGPSLNPGGGTPSYPCLKKSCQVYPADLTKMFFVTDGYPNTGGGAGQILADFPGWWSKFTECELICICIGGGGASFMQSLATLAGGTYVAA